MLKLFSFFKNEFLSLALRLKMERLSSKWKMILAHLSYSAVTLLPILSSWLLETGRKKSAECEFSISTLHELSLLVLL